MLPSLHWEREALEARYEAYRRRHATRLLTLLPREAIRPLYRRARRRAAEDGALDRKDPMGALVGLVLEHLPLPPFEVWRRDFEAHVRAHLDDEAPTPYAPRKPRPVTGGRTTFALGDARWRAILKVYRSDDGWRGYLAFGVEGEDGVRARTAEIFREESAEDVTDRFTSFDEPTLQAFLRSVLP